MGAPTLSVELAFPSPVVHSRLRFHRGEFGGVITADEDCGCSFASCTRRRRSSVSCGNTCPDSDVKNLPRRWRLVILGRVQLSFSSLSEAGSTAIVSPSYPTFYFMFCAWWILVLLPLLWARH